MNLYLSDFQIIRPFQEVPQETIMGWLMTLHKKESIESLLRLGMGSDKIHQRGLQIPHYFELNWSQLGSTERSSIFEKTIDEIFERFYDASSLPMEHLIHVTCTGYIAPSGAQKIVSKRNWGSQTVVSHAYHMGCYAAFPALRMGQAFSCDQGRIDIVHTELCSLHFNPSLDSMDQLVVQTLFGDGFIKYSLNSSGGLFQILALHEETLPNSMESLTWKCENWGMRMFIAKELPLLIAKSLKEYLDRLSKKAGMDFEKVHKKALFAIHPGGSKIIEQTAKILDLEPWQVAHSREILRTCGNMSSATLPHIWEKIAQDRPLSQGDFVVSLAFGPGITISGAIFK
jgi:predicted naringenin-chalcone synthase